MGAISNGNVLGSDIFAVLDVIDPDVQVAGALTTAWIDVEEYCQISALISAGTLGASATLDAKIQQATDASGTGAKDITGAVITQLTQAGTDSDKQAIINVMTPQLDIDNDFTHVQLSMTVAVATSDTAAHLFGFTRRHGPASKGNASSVDEIANAT